jgi:hypothetical protein
MWLNSHSRQFYLERQARPVPSLGDLLSPRDSRENLETEPMVIQPTALLQYQIFFPALRVTFYNDILNRQMRQGHLRSSIALMEKCFLSDIYCCWFKNHLLWNFKRNLSRKWNKPMVNLNLNLNLNIWSIFFLKFGRMASVWNLHWIYCNKNISNSAVREEEFILFYI